MSSNTEGGFTLHVKTSSGMEHIKISKKEAVSIKGSPVQHPDVKANKTMFQYAEEKLKNK